MTEGPCASFDVHIDAADAATVLDRLRTALGGGYGPATAAHDRVIGPLVGHQALAACDVEDGPPDAGGLARYR
ncbi:hypothetical protein [Streptomyces hydrogenans]|uniref:hypothetical protein n=1 Tax=Streptomyces hydrogenans TaxID=1873719 RepID=UPI00382B6CEB